jgi:hypothetical protein
VVSGNRTGVQKVYRPVSLPLCLGLSAVPSVHRVNRGYIWSVVWSACPSIVAFWMQVCLVCRPVAGQPWRVALVLVVGRLRGCWAFPLTGWAEIILKVVAIVMKVVQNCSSHKGLGMVDSE